MAEPIDAILLDIPARIADLAFHIAIPRDWNSLDLPAEEVDFSSPAAFFPLMLAAAPWAAVVLTVAARPGFGDGTLQDWSLFLLDSQAIRPTAFGPSAIGDLQGLAGVGRQQQDETWLEVKFAFFEDGGRLVHLGLMAPEAIAASLDSVWQTALRSFRLERPQGQTTPLGPGMGIVPETAADPQTPAAEVSAPQPLASPQLSQFTESDLGHYAKAEDASTLDPEHPTNSRLRDQGVGFVPNVLETDPEARAVKLAAGGIAATIRVAFGWHVIDDGRRTMVLDPDGKVQISLGVIQKEGRSVHQILDEIQAEAGQSYPDPEFLRLEDGGISALAIRNIVVNGEAVEQIHMLSAWAKDSAILRARVTADPQSIRFAANYADLILKTADYGQENERGGAPQEEAGAPAADPLNSGDQPEWLRHARQLEREDRLQEAEQMIADAIPNLHSAIATANLYRDRWLRLRKSDPSRAREARQQAANWAYTYASWATSGGEGTALSRERDAFLRTLGPEPLE